MNIFKSWIMRGRENKKLKEQISILHHFAWNTRDGIEDPKGAAKSALRRFNNAI